MSKTKKLVYSSANDKVWIKKVKKIKKNTLTEKERLQLLFVDQKPCKTGY